MKDRLKLSQKTSPKVFGGSKMVNTASSVSIFEGWSLKKNDDHCTFNPLKFCCQVSPFIEDVGIIRRNIWNNGATNIRCRVSARSQRQDGRDASLSSDRSLYQRRHMDQLFRGCYLLSRHVL
ncbi:uncharacterized protein LOC143427683 [Xylocopa sonorina]|uniref:uncharacterized protein LOC143427683 n=1 Tax=Xylocopa sonorina TaxID=1818115 RepID=UPI00403AE44E